MRLRAIYFDHSVATEIFLQDCFCCIEEETAAEIMIKRQVPSVAHATMQNERVCHAAVNGIPSSLCLLIRDFLLPRFLQKILQSQANICAKKSPLAQQKIIQRTMIFCKKPYTSSVSPGLLQAFARVHAD